MVQVVSGEQRSACIEKIGHCLIHDRLLLNDDKTDFIIIGTCQQLGKLQAMNIKVGGSEIEPVAPKLRT